MTDRMEKLGHAPEPKPPVLTARDSLLIEYQIFGCEHRSVCERIKRRQAVLDDTGAPVIREVPIEPGEPLTLEEAADLLGMRRRHARNLSHTPVYQRAYAAALQHMREGEKIRSLQRVVAIRDDAGAGKAADRKVQLAAASMILGEDVGPRPANVTVNINNTAVVAGMVIDLRGDDEAEAGAPITINHKDMQ